MSQNEMPTSRYIMIGGFLGAGKTTAVARFGHYLKDRGFRVGLISNDQSCGLVDTALLRSQGFHVAEIAGGCLCCRFNSLVDAARQLTADTRPDVLIAEPVGSCTDLVATVSYPLRRIYGDRWSIAPLSVLVDPVRCARILGLCEGRSFSDKVVYVYRKQLEEAAIIVINKCDAIEESWRAALFEALQETFPQAQVLSVSAKDGTGLDEWFGRIADAECGHAATMPIDYETYAAGEALLGWLNATVQVQADELFDANEWLLRLADQLRERLASDASEIAHLKMTLDSGGSAGSLSVVSLVGCDDEPDLRESMLDHTRSGELIVNLRAEADTELLKAATIEALGAGGGGVSTTVEHMECFRPKKPTPTHRLTKPDGACAGLS